MVAGGGALKDTMFRMEPKRLPFGPFGSEWNLVELSFSPAAINDAGLIVGTQNSSAVQDQNGSLQVLPLFLGGGVISAAVDVAAAGAIVGSTSAPGVPAVLWFPLPLSFSEAPVGVFVPAAINKTLLVVGTSEDAQVAFKWNANIGYTSLLGPGDASIPVFATDVNDVGFIVGFTESPETRTGLLWHPDATTAAPWALGSIRSVPRINNGGDSVAIDATGVVSIVSLNGTISTFPTIVNPQSVDGISDEGRLIGTSIVGGVKRGWTFYKNQLTWLDPPTPDQGDYVHPSGVNTCGNIVGRVLQQGGTFVQGVLFAKSHPVLGCDGRVREVAGELHG